MGVCVCVCVRERERERDRGRAGRDNETRQQRASSKWEGEDTTDDIKKNRVVGEERHKDQKCAR